MSQAARSKSKDKKVSKEPPKVASKPSSANPGAGVPASGYNPLMGTFHTIDAAPVTSNAAVHINGRFRNIDERDDLSGHSHGAGGEYETVSNNGSWSGEEDHKEKTSNLPLRQETLLVGADNDKREKIRQKNERKHQRQKERRAQELHEKCTGYLMSRKLETLAEQLVAMGFSSEQATMALILNEGKVEETVAWLLEGGEEANQDEEQSLDTEGTLKIDISEEFARIADMEIRFNCSKQDVERAIVACEGDLERAEDMLRSQKQETPSVPSKPEETSDPPTMGNDKLPIGATENLTRVPVKPSSSSTIPAKRDDKDFGYPKVVAPAGPSMDPGSKNIPLLMKRAQPKLDLGKAPQVSVPVDKRWSNPSVSYSLASSLQVPAPPAETEASYVAVGNELKNIQLGTVRKPVIVVQRPQSVNARHTPTSNVSSSLPGTAAPFYSNNIVGTVTSNGMIPHIPATRSLSTNSVSTNQLYNQLHYQQHQQPEQFVSSYGTLESSGTSRGNSLWSRTGGASQTQSVAAAPSLGLFSGLGTNDGTYGEGGASQTQSIAAAPSLGLFSGLGTNDGTYGEGGASQTQSIAAAPSLGLFYGLGINATYGEGGASQTQSIAAASSLGLFSGLGTNGTYGLSSPLSWSTIGCSVRQLDYQNIDWSLDCGSSSSGTGSTSPTSTDPLMRHYDPKYDSFYRGVAATVATTPVLPNEIGGSIPGSQDGASTAETPASSTSTGASREWTSPFEERDLFSLPWQFVSSPSL